MTVLSPYRHPTVTSHPIESQCNKSKGDGVTVINQHSHTLLLIRQTEASHGFEVIGTDYNKELFTMHNACKTTLKENGLDELFQT